MAIHPNAPSGRQHIYAIMQNSETKPKVQAAAQDFIEQVEMFDLVISQPFYIHGRKRYYNKYNTISHEFDSKEVSGGTKLPVHDPSIAPFYRRDFLISKVAAFARTLFPADAHQQDQAKRFLQYKLFGDLEWCDYLAYGIPDEEKNSVGSDRLLAFCSKLVDDQLLSEAEKEAKRKK